MPWAFRRPGAWTEEGVYLHVLPLKSGFANIAPAYQRRYERGKKKLFHGFPFLGLVFDCSRLPSMILDCSRKNKPLSVFSRGAAEYAESSGFNLLTF